MAHASGAFVLPGDAQTSLFVLRRVTVNANPVELAFDALSERLTVAAGRTMTFDILVTARTANATPALSAGYHMRGVIENDNGATGFIGVPTVTTLGEDAAAAGWDATVIADDSNEPSSSR